MISKLMPLKALVCAGLLLGSLCSGAVVAKEKVKVSLFSWPGYGFWFIAKEKNLVPDLELDITIIEDPYESFGLMNAGQLDVASSTVEYGPIAADTKQPIRLVSYNNTSYGVDRIILGPKVEEPKELVGEKVAVLEGGLSQIFMGIWLEDQGIKIDQVEFVNVIMDDAVAAMVSGQVAAGQFWEPFGTTVLKNLDGARVVASSLEPYWLKTALLGDGIYMNKNFIDKRPEAAKMVMQAYYRAVKFWKDNPKAGNKIIAEGIKFELADVEAVIGTTGEPKSGGLAVFGLDESAKFMGVKKGKPPLGLSNNEMKKHWDLTSTWWVKFGLIKEKKPMTKGVDLGPIKAVVAEP